MVEHSLLLREMVVVTASEQSRVNSSSGRDPIDASWQRPQSSVGPRHLVETVTRVESDNESFKCSGEDADARDRNHRFTARSMRRLSTFERQKVWVITVPSWSPPRVG